MQGDIKFGCDVALKDSVVLNNRLDEQALVENKVFIDSYQIWE